MHPNKPFRFIRHKQLNAPMHKFKRWTSYGEVVYGGGVCVVQEMRMRAPSASAFDRQVKTLVTMFRGRNLTGCEFLAFFGLANDTAFKKMARLSTLKCVDV